MKIFICFALFAYFGTSKAADAEKVESRDKYGWTPLMYAAKAGDVEKVQELLGKGANPRARDLMGRDAVWYLTNHTNIAGVHRREIAKILLAAPLPLGAEERERARLQEISLEQLRKEIEIGLRLDVQDKKGRTLLMQFAAAGHLPGCELLVKSGADLFLRDSEGRTARDYVGEESRRLDQETRDILVQLLSSKK